MLEEIFKPLSLPKKNNKTLKPFLAFILVLTILTKGECTTCSESSFPKFIGGLSSSTFIEAIDSNAATN